MILNGSEIKRMKLKANEINNRTVQNKRAGKNMQQKLITASARIIIQVFRQKCCFTKTMTKKANNVNN